MDKKVFGKKKVRGPARPPLKNVPIHFRKNLKNKKKTFLLPKSHQIIFFHKMDPPSQNHPKNRLDGQSQLDLIMYLGVIAMLFFSDSFNPLRMGIWQISKKY